MKTRAAVIALAGTMLTTISPAQAQTYPSKPIRLVVGFAAGGGTDYVARAIAPRLTEALGQPLIVENRPGAAGTLGNDLVAKAAADGYTLLAAAAGPMTVAPNFLGKLPYDTFKDFDPVALIVTSPFVLVVNPTLPIKTLAEFDALAKAKPGSINFGSSGTGGSPHLAGELYKRMAGIDIVHVPYKGLAPALTDLLGGQIQAVFADIGLALKQIEAGKLRPLAVTGAQRFAALPTGPAGPGARQPVECRIRRHDPRGFQQMGPAHQRSQHPADPMSAPVRPSEGSTHPPPGRMSHSDRWVIK